MGLSSCGSRTMAREGTIPPPSEKISSYDTDQFLDMVAGVWPGTGEQLFGPFRDQFAQHPGTFERAIAYARTNAARNGREHVELMDLWLLARDRA
jgi:hypothetical protein